MGRPKISQLIADVSREDVRATYAHSPVEAENRVAGWNEVQMAAWRWEEGRRSA